MTVYSLKKHPRKNFLYDSLTVCVLRLYVYRRSAHSKDALSSEEIIRSLHRVVSIFRFSTQCVFLCVVFLFFLFLPNVIVAVSVASLEV